jgi:hypothetical protein
VLAWQVALTAPAQPGTSSIPHGGPASTTATPSQGRAGRAGTAGWATGWASALDGPVDESDLVASSGGRAGRSGPMKQCAAAAAGPISAPASAEGRSGPGHGGAAGPPQMELSPATAGAVPPTPGRSGRRLSLSDLSAGDESPVAATTMAPVAREVAAVAGAVQATPVPAMTTPLPAMPTAQAQQAQPWVVVAPAAAAAAADAHSTPAAPPPAGPVPSPRADGGGRAAARGGGGGGEETGQRRLSLGDSSSLSSDYSPRSAASPSDRPWPARAGGGAVVGHRTAAGTADSPSPVGSSLHGSESGDESDLEQIPMDTVSSISVASSAAATTAAAAAIADREASAAATSAEPVTARVQPPMLGASAGRKIAAGPINMLAEGGWVAAGAAPAAGASGGGLAGWAAAHMHGGRGGGAADRRAVASSAGPSGGQPAADEEGSHGLVGGARPVAAAGDSAGGAAAASTPVPTAVRPFGAAWATPALRRQQLKSTSSGGESADVRMAGSDSED